MSALMKMNTFYKKTANYFSTKIELCQLYFT